MASGRRAARKSPKLPLGCAWAAALIIKRNRIASRLIRFSSVIAGHQMPFPGIGRYDDLAQIVMSRLPVEERAHLFAGGGDGGGIAGATGALIGAEVNTRNIPHHVDH